MQTINIYKFALAIERGDNRRQISRIRWKILHLLNQNANTVDINLFILRASITKTGVILNSTRKRPFGEVKDVLGVESSAKRANLQTNASAVHNDENRLELPKPEPRVSI